MENAGNVITLDSVDAYCRLYGLKCFHPLAAVVDLNKAVSWVNHVVMDYGLYALYLKNGVNCTVVYGRQPYDYQEGTVVSFAPGQRVRFDSDSSVPQQDVLGLLFHPDLIVGTPLGAQMHRYSFFDYSQRESLHLSEEERGIFTGCLERIRIETEYPADSHSAGIIASHIQVLLDYLNRFYARQFATRRKVNGGVLSAFERGLREYYLRGRGEEGVPTVAYFASASNLSPGYFGDLVKRETGESPQKIISRHVVNIAKQRLASTADDVSVIAYDLGFQYPQHFTRLFKRATGMSPSRFRADSLHRD